LIIHDNNFGRNWEEGRESERKESDGERGNLRALAIELIGISYSDSIIFANCFEV
jgi:hypothetical protein